MPEYTAGIYREQLLQAARKGLGRKVEIGEVRFRLLPTPGFAISDVRIGEDPTIGSEPAAYVGTLVARPAIRRCSPGASPSARCALKTPA